MGLCRVCLLYFVNKANYVSLQLRAKKRCLPSSISNVTKNKNILQKAVRLTSFQNAQEDKRNNFKPEYRKWRRQWRPWSTPWGWPWIRAAVRPRTATTFFGWRWFGTTAWLLPLGIRGWGSVATAFLLLFSSFFWCDSLKHDRNNGIRQGNIYWLHIVILHLKLIN